MGLCTGWYGGGLAALIAAFLVFPAPLLLRQTTEVPPLVEKSTNNSIEEFIYVTHMDLLLIGLMLGCPAFLYFNDWILRHALERRINKLNKKLTESLHQLQGMDEKDRQMDATLRLLKEATAEYNLLLYLLLERRRTHPTRRERSFDKELRENFSYLRSFDV